MAQRGNGDNFVENSRCLCFCTVQLASLDKGNDPPLFSPGSHLPFHLSHPFFLSSRFCFSRFHSAVLSRKALLFSTNNICISMLGIIVFPSCTAFLLSWAL